MLTPEMTREQFMFGLADGVTVLSVAAAFWLGLAAWTLGAIAMLVAAVPILLLGSLLIWGGSRLRRHAAGLSRASFRNAPKGSSSRRISARFSVVGMAQTLSVGLVGIICWRLNRFDLIWPLIGLVVSLHFLPIGWIVSVRPYYVIGVLGTAIALTSILGFSGSTRTVAVGLGLGLLIGGCAAYLVANAAALADKALHLRSSPAEAR